MSILQIPTVTPNDVYSVLLSKDVLSCTGCVDQQFYNREWSPKPCHRYAIFPSYLAISFIIC